MTTELSKPPFNKPEAVRICGYDQGRRRLYLEGVSLETAAVTAVLKEGIPDSLDAIVYSTPTMTVIIRGHVLRRFIANHV